VIWMEVLPWLLMLPPPLFFLLDFAIALMVGKKVLLFLIITSSKTNGIARAQTHSLFDGALRILDSSFHFSDALYLQYFELWV